jgi:hypothetical protein
VCLDLRDFALGVVIEPLLCFYAEMDGLNSMHGLQGIGRECAIIPSLAVVDLQIAFFSPSLLLILV